MLDRHYTLYRAWRDSKLLYVGITVNSSNRMSEHAQSSDWWNETTHMTFERLGADIDRVGALEIEAQAIRDEQPLFNVVGNPHHRGFRLARTAERRNAAASATGSSQAAKQILNLMAEREVARAELAELDAERQELVRRGFDEGLSARAMAVAAGVSRPRIYQIRDGRR